MKKVMFKLEENPEIEKLLNDNSTDVLVNLFNLWKEDVYENCCTVGFEQFIKHYLKWEDMVIDGVEIDFSELDSLKFNAKKMDFQMVQILENY